MHPKVGKQPHIPLYTSNKMNRRRAFAQQYADNEQKGITGESIEQIYLPMPRFLIVYIFLPSKKRALLE